MLLSSHPGPTAAVTVLCLVLGLAIGLEPWRLVVLGLAVLAGQLSIGFSNDAIDAARDAEVGRTDKPIARGDIGRRAVAIAAAVALVIALALSAVLGLGMLVAHTIVIAGGWLYNAWLKRTALSVVPFIVSFGTVPSLATLSAPDPAAAALWASATGAILGISIHFTNALPDLADDRRTGVRGLPHRLGRRAAGAVAFAALATGAVIVLVGPTVGGFAATRPPGVVELVGFAATIGIAVVGLVLALRRPAHRVLFRLVMAAGLLIAIQLTLGGVRLVG
ncbi:1,4-dihydroxy-2-naphthoate prenyltransferase [Labedella phragmitis]|uniref:1,4-dihydroxy-2-naphthoate prenyltransferase n=1 Tax=Labedella phragmitis TaxID=2498849 RepID=A0A3S4BJ03_9MICO|nr:UbiA family prenyltransferase [Labedella phragmitis]RWZ51230.1 1,4-dihydroxy-2-naphthoate prenyltransferase [Labedella phragmitis]